MDTRAKVTGKTLYAADIELPNLHHGKIIFAGFPRAKLLKIDTEKAGKRVFCGMCHNVNHPVNGLPLEATYTEWKNGPYAKEGIQCQDCHMTPGAGVTKPNPGQLTSFSETRPYIYSHSIVGGNFAVAGLLGSEEHKNLAQERLKAAGKVEILGSSAVRTAEGIAFKVKVSNVGAGHYLPTGLTETRQMWLHITVKDNSGKMLWESGALDAKGEIKPGAVIYNTVIADKNGRHTDRVWEAAKITYDHRIPPKSSVVENIQVKSADLPMTVKVSVELMYRPAPQDHR